MAYETFYVLDAASRHREIVCLRLGPFTESSVECQDSDIASHFSTVRYTGLLKHEALLFPIAPPHARRSVNLRSHKLAIFVEIIVS